MPAAKQPEPGNDELPVIEFVAPLPGFPDDSRFLLVQVHESGLLYSLTSVKTRGLRFLVAPPAPFFPAYAPEIDDDIVVALGTTDPDDLLVLLIITPGESARDATANLLAPIVLDRATRRATQLILAGSGLPVREPLLATTGAGR
jgi:flagellar assembly factor FliW